MQAKLVMIVCDNSDCVKTQWIDLKDGIVIPFKHCGICKYVYYCSAECQRHHWPTHRPSCSKLPKHLYSEVIRAQNERKLEEPSELMYELLDHPAFNIGPKLPVVSFKMFAKLAIENKFGLMQRFKKISLDLIAKIEELKITKGYVIAVRGLEIIMY